MRLDAIVASGHSMRRMRARLHDRASTNHASHDSSGSPMNSSGSMEPPAELAATVSRGADSRDRAVRSEELEHLPAFAISIQAGTSELAWPTIARRQSPLGNLLYTDLYRLAKRACYTQKGKAQR